MRENKTKKIPRMYWFLALGFSLLLLILIKPKNAGYNKASNYAIYSQDKLYQPSYYPLNQKIDANLYQPVGLWTGRLILPAQNQRKPDGSVLFEIYHADAEHQNLVGKIVMLQWSRDPQTQDYIQTVRRDVNFTEAARNSQKTGQVHPERLNNWQNVNPLESLAGARRMDDAIVKLKNPVAVSAEPDGQTSLVINQEPVQITGHYYSLVTIIKRESAADNLFTVRHYNKNSKQFDGSEEKIRIPQVPDDRYGIPRSTKYRIEASPVNPQGWYIYGAKAGDGIFVVQAIEPRTITRLQPDAIFLGKASGLDYINREIWRDTEAQKGTAKTVLLDPLAHNKHEAVANWQEGDRAIVIHTFGGIGGKKGEKVRFGLVTGHFAYGTARVVRDRLSDELRFDIEYQQVYANNPDGIVSGAMNWSNYMGDLWRGWLGNRPVSDIVVKLDAVTQDYDFDGIKLSPMSELIRQLDIMMARYRVGDGTGAAIVTPATSCVQDSNQALYVTIQRMQSAVAANPPIQNWLNQHPNDPQTLRFQQLVKLGQRLEKNLVPLGIVRSDWQNNADKLAGTNIESGLISKLLKAATTWRTVLPRRGHDEIAAILLKNGGTLWVIRTNQVGGFDPDITPLAPTAIFGHSIK